MLSNIISKNKKNESEKEEIDTFYKVKDKRIFQE